ncbi:MAG: sulfocyanin-like copper-binding protein, partial [Gemmatimonadales bacterium]
MRRLVLVMGVLGGGGLAAGGAIGPAAAAQGFPPPNISKIDPAWLRADTATKTVEFELIAGLTGYNGALNFNGYRDGELTLTVPLGWTVVMHFKNNDGDLPHSAEVIPDARPIPLGPVDPALERAFTIKLAQGLQAGEEDDIRFVANKAGSFLIFCAVPGHGAAGMWIRLHVAEGAKAPALSATKSGGGGG